MSIYKYPQTTTSGKLLDNLEVNDAIPTDIDEIVSIENSSFDIEAFSRSQFKYLIAHASGKFLVVRYNGHMVAYISLLKRKDTRHLRIYSIAISPQMRGMGIGQLLIDKAIEYAVANNLDTISLEVRTDNIPALALYEKNGFEKSKLLYRYYGDNIDAYYMRKLIIELATP